jgi:predicted phosphodiesterase
MPAKPLSRELAIETLQAVDAAGGNISHAAEALGLPRATVQSRVRTAANLGITLQSESTRALPFEEAWRLWMRAIGMAKDRYPLRTTSTPKGRAGHSVRTTSTQKILVIPDLHAPFHEEQMFAAMLEREADADHVICIGDLGDSYALSRFEKYERMPYREEWAAVNLCMQEMASRFPSVEIVIGNHDARLERQLRQRLTEDMVDAIHLITGGILCPITAMAKRYPNVTIAKHETPSGKHVDWFTTIGDAWLGHPEKYSRVPGSALRAVEEWISDNEAALGMDPYRLVVMGHTHAMSWLPWRAGKLLVECGCLCQQQGYMLSPRVGGRPQRRGYITFEQTDGRTDLNSIRMVWFDAIEKVA